MHLPHASLHLCKHGFGLLGRIVDIQPVPNDTAGLILVTCPPGWRAMPLFVLVFATADPSGTFDFYIDHPASNFYWSQQADVPLYTAPFSQKPALYFPHPDGLDMFSNSGNAVQIPIVDGDDVGRNTFRTRRVSALAAPTYTYFVYGMAWPSSD